jgi:tRNA/tmRNA/rRNA uracil-C5-methylase (TrmA/RlmC/RlmD family)
MSYDAQCEAKRNRMGRILSRAIGRETQPKFIRSPEQFGYRTHFSIGWANRGGEPLIGLTDPETRDIVDVASCMLIPDWANAGYSRLRDSLTAAAGQLPEHFRLRLFLDHEARQVYAVAPRGPKKEHRRVPSSLGSILARFPAPHTIERRVLGVTLRLHPASFVQANNYLTESLYAEGLQAAQPQGNDVVCELYSGSGFFTLALAPKVKRAVAIEADKRAVDNLAKSAEDVIRSMKRGKRKQEPDIQVAQGKAEDLAEEVMKEFKPTLVIANPPRSGLHPRVVEAVAKSEGVRRIVMISCDAATLARDVRGLMNAGFEAEEPVALDCYPQTVHVETVMALRR